jgi:hypothetical protein
MRRGVLLCIVLVVLGLFFFCACCVFLVLVSLFFAVGLSSCDRFFWECQSFNRSVLLGDVIKHFSLGCA